MALTAAGHAAVMEEPAYALQPKKLTMWLFIISDSVTFGAILFAYGFLRVGSTDSEHARQVSSILSGIVMTFVCFESTDDGCHPGSGEGRPRILKRMTMGLTVLLGVISLLHIREWIHIIR